MGHAANTVRAVAAAAVTCVVMWGSVGCSDDDPPRTGATSSGASPEADAQGSAGPGATDESPEPELPPAGTPSPSTGPSTGPSTEGSSPRKPTRATGRAQPAKPSRAEYRAGWSQAMGVGAGQEDPGMARFLDCMTDQTYDDLSAEAVRAVAEGRSGQPTTKQDDAVLEAAYETCSATG